MVRQAHRLPHHHKQTSGASIARAVALHLNLQGMEAPARQQVATLSVISQDSFLAALDPSLKRLSQRWLSVSRSSCYTVEGHKEAEEEAVAAMCGILTLMGLQGGASEEDLKKLLVSSGLQEDRARLLLAQRGQLAEVSNVWKQQYAPLKELVDLQWRLGVVAGSSEKDEAGRTFVQVNFITQTSGDARRSNMLVEMSLEKFYDFLHQLEKCKASLEHNRHLL